MQNPRKHVCKKDNIWNPSACTYENGKYLKIIIDDSAVKCDECLDKAQSEPVTFNNKKATREIENFSILHFFFKYHTAITSLVFTTTITI